MLKNNIILLILRHLKVLLEFLLKKVDKAIDSKG